MAGKPESRLKISSSTPGTLMLGWGQLNSRETSWTCGYLTHGDKGIGSNDIKISCQSGWAGLLYKLSFPGPQTLHDTMINSQTRTGLCFRSDLPFPSKDRCEPPAAPSPPGVISQYAGEDAVLDERCIFHLEILRSLNNSHASLVLLCG